MPRSASYRRLDDDDNDFDNNDDHDDHHPDYPGIPLHVSTPVRSSLGAPMSLGDDGSGSGGGGVLHDIFSADNGNGGDGSSSFHFDQSFDRSFGGDGAATGDSRDPFDIANASPVRYPSSTAASSGGGSNNNNNNNGSGSGVNESARTSGWDDPAPAPTPQQQEAGAALQLRREQQVEADAARRRIEEMLNHSSNVNRSRSSLSQQQLGDSVAGMSANGNGSSLGGSLLVDNSLLVDEHGAGGETNEPHAKNASMFARARSRSTSRQARRPSLGGGREPVPTPWPNVHKREGESDPSR